MKRVAFILPLLFMAVMASAQEKETFPLNGLVLDAETLEGVPMVSVIIQNKKKGTSGLSDGRFKIPVSIGDVILISSIGYQPMEFRITETFKENQKEELALLMIPQVYELDSVVVLHLGEDFYLRRKKGEPVEIIGLPKPTDNPRDWSKPQVVADGNGVGIYGLLNVFDKQLQQQKKVRKLQAALDKENELNTKLEAKYNKALVKEVTGIDDRVIDEFMEFCNFTRGEILQSTEYEITARLLKRYQAFLRR